MGCGCSKASTNSIQKSTAGEMLPSRGTFLGSGRTDDQNAHSGFAQPDSVERFNRKSEFEDFFDRNPARPQRNKAMSDAYAQSDLNQMEDQGKPRTTLQMEYIYGYRCFLSKQNLYYTMAGEAVAYPAAAVIVLLSKSSNTQMFLGGGDLVSTQGHSDIILTLAVNSRRNLLASGEIGDNPLICVWKIEGETVNEQKRFDQGAGTRAVAALCFSGDSKLLFAVDQAQRQQIRVYDWKESSIPTHTLTAGSGRIWNLSCSPKPGHFCAVGRDYFAFWYLKTTEYAKQQPKDYDRSVAMNVVQWLSTGNCVTGGSDGKVYLWIERALKKSYQILDPGCEINALTIVADVILVGGESNSVIVLNATFKETAKYQVPDWVISLDKYEEHVLCGTRNGVIQELQGHQRAVLMESHCEREAWSLAQDPKDWNLIISTGDDNKIKSWDLLQKRCVSTCIMEALQGDRVHRTSLLPMNQQSRALCISPRGHVAVAHNDGKITIRNNIHQLNLILKVLTDPKNWIQCMRYSPRGSALAIGSHDNSIYVYDVNASYTLFHTLTGHTAITSLDWSLDETLLKTCELSGRLLVWNVETEALVPEPEPEEWATWTSHTGKAVGGISQVTSEPDFVTTVCRSTDGKKVAVGNSWGLLEIYDFPNQVGAKANVYRGHSQEVVNALWARQDRILLTSGGPDLSIIQWRVVEKN